MLPAKNYNIVNFILSSLDCYFPWQFFVNRTRGKDFQGGGKKRKINKNRYFSYDNKLKPMALNVSTCSSTATIRYNKRRIWASLCVEIDNFSRLEAFIFFRSIRQKLESHRRISPIEVHTDFYSTSYLNITMNGTIISLEKCSNRSSLDGSNRKSRYSPSCFDREAVKKNTEPRSSWNQNKIYVAIHEHPESSRCQWSKKKVPLFLGLRDPYRSLLLYR